MLPSAAQTSLFVRLVALAAILTAALPGKILHVHTHGSGNGSDCCRMVCADAVCSDSACSNSACSDRSIDDCPWSAAHCQRNERALSPECTSNADASEKSTPDDAGPLPHRSGDCGICLILAQCAPAMPEIEIPVPTGTIDLPPCSDEFVVSSDPLISNARGPPQQAVA